MTKESVKYIFKNVFHSVIDTMHSDCLAVFN